MQWTVIVLLQMKGITIEALQPTFVLFYNMKRLNDHLYHGNLQIFHINDKHLNLDGHCPFNITVSFIF